MSELDGGLDAPINIRKGVESLVNYVETKGANEYEPLELGQEIDFGDGEIRSIVTVEKVKKLADRKFAVTISFTIGPL